MGFSDNMNLKIFLPVNRRIHEAMSGTKSNELQKCESSLSISPAEEFHRLKKFFELKGLFIFHFSCSCIRIF